MLSVKKLLGIEVRAVDGVAGRIADLLIDEERWMVVYAVVPVGGVLSGERRLIAVEGLVLAGQNRVLASPHKLVELDAMSPNDLTTKAEEGWAAVNDDTPPHTPASYTPQPRSRWRSFNAMLGCNVAASDGGYGSLDDMLVELQQWRIQYFVARSYSWKKKPSILIPTAWVEQVSWKGETVNVAVSKDTLEREPSYRPDSHAQ